MIRKIIVLIFSLLLTLSLSGCGSSPTTSAPQEGNIQVVDDLGKTIVLQQPAKRIISLYSAHTENLFDLGLEQEIIGVSSKETYPPASVKKPAFDYNGDPEKILAQQPDLVLIRPFIQKSKPDFVKALENANITVVCLYPENFNRFDDYIRKLALLTGKETVAEEKLRQFHQQLDEIKKTTSNITPKKRVFFESTETEYRTITPDSIPANLLQLAGGINVAADAKAVSKESSIASYGVEKILARAAEIDVYIAQSGAMNAGGSPASIKIRPAFNEIKAVQQNQIYNVDEKLVSSPTFRLALGTKQLARILYPEVFDSLAPLSPQTTLSRQELAEMVVKYKHKEFFSPTSKHYNKTSGHLYGSFVDIALDHPAFHYIETAVQAGYLAGTGNNFEPDKAVTRDELSRVLFQLADVKDTATDITIKDRSLCEKPRIVELIVKNQILTLDQQKQFNPSATVSVQEALAALNKLPQR